MRQKLPSAIASALEAAQAQHASGHIPDVPFQPTSPAPPAPPAQASLLPEPPAKPEPWSDWLAELLAHVAPVLEFLSSMHQELGKAAQMLPGQLYMLSQREAYPGADARLVAAAERRFGEPVPGRSLAAQAARARDAKYASLPGAPRARGARAAAPAAWPGR